MGAVSLRRIAVVAAMSVGLFVGGAASADPPSNATVWLYYADEAMTVLVGGESLDCSGHLIRWGELSVYREQIDYGECPA
jgi:hypothetical protein